MNEKIEKFNYAGLKFDRYKLKTCIEMAIAAIENQKRMIVAVPSTRMVSYGQEHEDYRDYVNTADLSIPDSTSILLASKLSRTPIDERVTGPDFMLAMCEQADKRRFKVYFLGTTEETLHRLKKKLTELYPGMVICGILPLPFGNVADMGTKEIIDTINQSKPDIVFVGMSAPKQEYWIKAYKDRVASFLFIGVGAAFDFISGNIPRAPKIVRSIGLEWLYRSIVDPKRELSTPFRGLPVYVYRLFILFLVNHPKWMKLYMWFKAPFNEKGKIICWRNNNLRVRKEPSGYKCKALDDETLATIQFDRSVKGVNKFKNIVGFPNKCFCIYRKGRPQKVGWAYYPGCPTYHLASGEVVVEISLSEDVSDGYEVSSALISGMLFLLNAVGVNRVYCFSPENDPKAYHFMSSLGFKIYTSYKQVLEYE